MDHYDDWGTVMKEGEITRRDRVLCPLGHEQPDRTPADFQAVGEIWQAVLRHFGTLDSTPIPPSI